MTLEGLIKTNIKQLEVKRQKKQSEETRAAFWEMIRAIFITIKVE